MLAAAPLSRAFADERNMFLSLNSVLLQGRVHWPDFARLAAQIGFPGTDIMLRPAMQAGFRATNDLLARLKIRPAVIDFPVEFRKDDATFNSSLTQLDAAAQFAAAILIVLGLWMVVRELNFIYDPHEFYGIPAYCLQDYERARVASLLERTPGQHLVIVHQRRIYDGGRDWVYNDAKIDASKIVWARDMGWEKNKELVSYFHSRQAWYIDQSDGLFQLHPYHGTDPFQEYALQAVKGVPLAR